MITPTGTTTSTVPGQPYLSVVVDPKTGTAYQTTVASDAATGQFITRAAAITTAGITISPVDGYPVGSVVVDSKTGTAYQTSSYGGNTWVATITPSGTTISTLAGNAEPPGVVVDPATGTVYQTTSTGVYVVGVAPLATPIGV